ncbi:MAG: FtsW/RodA/SpoVE family cell cycle protein, partial [Negativicutes bacterium]|nr:FtsW/RodA/SpoVE family cell cycle protein [Negativicutes bacterium]
MISAVLAAVFTTLGLTGLMLKTGTWHPVNLWPALWLLVAGGGSHLILARKRPAADRVFLEIALILLAVGFVFIFRLAPRLLFYQALWSVIGLAAFVVLSVSRRLPSFFLRYQYVNGLAAVIFLLSAVLLGVDIGGHRDWVVIGPLRVQPAELAKVLLVGFLAAWLAERRALVREVVWQRWGLRLPSPKVIGPLVVVWILTMLMLVLQRDLGSSLLYFATAFLLFFVAGGRRTQLILAGLIFLLSAYACYQLYGHIRTRVDIWIDPWSDPDGKSFQVVQSIFAFANGGLLGTGLGYGLPGTIPEVHTDFILAAIAEEMGFCFVALLLAVYACLFYRGMATALAGRDSYTLLLAM